MKEVYLDHAGATLPEPQITNSWTDELQSSKIYANPHSQGSRASTRTVSMIHHVRSLILAHLFNTTQQQYCVIFCQSTTAALRILGDSYLNDSNDHLWIMKECLHTSVLGMRNIALDRGAKVTLFTEPSGQIVPDNNSKNNLVIYPAQCNFSGIRYQPLHWTQQKLIQQQVHTCIDAASYLTTGRFSLKDYPADFVVLSFYKIFGMPTGLGALIVKKSSLHTLLKSRHLKYFGGGSVDGAN